MNDVGTMSLPGCASPFNAFGAYEPELGTSVPISSVVFGPIADLGAIYLISSLVLGGVFLALALKVQRTESPAVAMRLFTYSITYVTLLFGAMALDQLVQNA